MKDKMRTYHGDIKGFFWFGFQSSYDAKNIGGKNLREIEEVTNHDENKHEVGCVEFYFGQEQLDEVTDHCIKLRKQVGHLVKGLEIFNNDFEYDIDIQYLVATDEEEELIARYCLARQIIECIKTNGECRFVCEL